MFRNLFCRLSTKNVRSIAAGLAVAGSALAATAFADDPRRNSGTFYDQNRPVDTGDIGLNQLLFGAQNNLSRNPLRAYVNDLEARLDRALHQVGELYNVPSYVREWMHDFMADEKQRIGVDNTLPSASQAIAEAVTNTQVTPTAMDTRIMNQIMSRMNRQFESLPGFDEGEAQVRLWIGEKLKERATEAVQPEALRRELAEHPEVARVVASFVVDHPETLIRAPWLAEPLTPYIEQNRQQAAANPTNTNSTSSGLGIASESTSLVYVDSAPRANANSFNADNANVGTLSSATTASTDANPNPASMTQAEFRQNIEQAMRQFQQADVQNQEDLARPRAQTSGNPSNNGMNGSRTTYDESATRQPVARDYGGLYAPRNGYNEYGNRGDSNRQQYDVQGYYTNGNANSSSSSSADFFSGSQNQLARPVVNQPVRQNRVYNSYDGTSRPIGSGRSSAAQQFQAVQAWSQNQIARQQTGRPSAGTGYGGNSTSSGSNNSGSSQTPYNTNSSNGQPSNSTSGTPQPSIRLVFDDNAPRRQSAGSLMQSVRVGSNDNARSNDPRISPSAISSMYSGNQTQSPNNPSGSVNQSARRTNSTATPTVQNGRVQPQVNVQHSNGHIQPVNNQAQHATSQRQPHTPVQHSNVPTVAPRTQGVQSNTANLGPAISVRANGVQPHTAALTGF